MCDLRDILLQYFMNNYYHISTGIEGPTVNAIPFVPDSLSYSEMFNSEFKYPANWSANWDSYQKNKMLLIESIKNLMDNYESMIPRIKLQQESLLRDFFSAGVMVETIKENTQAS